MNQYISLLQVAKKAKNDDIVIILSYYHIEVPHRNSFRNNFFSTSKTTKKALDEAPKGAPRKRFEPGQHWGWDLRLGRMREKNVYTICVGEKYWHVRRNFIHLEKKRFEGLKGEIVMLEFRKKNILCLHWNNHRTSIWWPRKDMVTHLLCQSLTL